jgi:hypothetical protein
MKKRPNLLLAFIFFNILCFGQAEKEVSIKKTNFNAYFNGFWTMTNVQNTNVEDRFSRNDRPFGKPYTVGEVFYDWKNVYNITHIFTQKINVEAGIKENRKLSNNLDLVL